MQATEHDVGAPDVIGAAQPDTASRRLLVAAEVDDTPVPQAHAVPDLGVGARHYGVALCGFPAEHLALVPDLTWAEVNRASRCGHCQSAWAAGRRSSSDTGTSRRQARPGGDLPGSGTSG